MMLRAIVLFLVAVGLVLQSGVQSTTAQTANPTLLGAIVPPGSDFMKLPRLASTATRVYLGGNNNGTIQHWSKAPEATNFEGAATIASTPSDRNYFTGSIAAASNGTVYSAWSVKGQGVFLRGRNADGTLRPLRTVKADGVNRFFVDVGVTTDNTIIVTWDGEEIGGTEPRFFATWSKDDGATWSNPVMLVDERAYRTKAFVATGPNNTAAIFYYGFPGFNVYASIWNGNGFTRELVAKGGSGTQPADPTGTISGNGVYYAAWRNAPSGAGDVYYAERKAANSWGTSRLAGGGSTNGLVAIDADAANNLHVAWVNNVTGAWQSYYMFKAAGGDWKGPIPRNDGFTYNAAVEGTLGSQAYGHVAYERFTGDTMVNRYLLYGAQGANIGPTGNPALEGGAAVTKNTSIPLTFSGLTGNPTEVRWNWGAPPTDAENDSGGWKPINPAPAVAIPSDLSPTSCQNLTLYTQVRNGTSVQTAAANDSILFDAAAQASAIATNPNLSGQNSTYAQGAHSGAVNFTREMNYILKVTDLGDCSGLASFGPTGGSQTVFPAGKNPYTTVVPLQIAPGPIPSLTIDVFDRINNSTPFPQSMFYDPRNGGNSQTPNAGAPVVAGGTFALNNANSVLRTLTFSGVDVSDTIYGQATGLPKGAQFWGVFVAVSREPVQDVNSPSSTLQWAPIRVLSPGSSFSVQYSLFSGQTGLPTNQTGDYYVYVKFIDGAGNPSVETLPVQKATLTAGYSLPTTYLPLMRR